MVYCLAGFFIYHDEGRYVLGGIILTLLYKNITLTLFSKSVEATVVFKRDRQNQIAILTHNFFP